MAVFMEKKMTTLMLFVCALICLVPTGAIASGMDPCQDSDLQISTAPTGKIVGGQSEYLVTIRNQCSCAVSGVVFYCQDGLSSTEPVDKNMIHIVDNKSMLCLVHNGWPIFKGSQVTFTYAWRTPLSFSMYDATTRC
ncbi:unnamed protein product [Urochloa decumbens]|uniref:Uncharacterized protein n=1 Tax=Urochloa decumbens TaxID=240449 RepID=A0ABC9BN71_9POAL